MENIDNLCKELGCKHYIEWEYYGKQVSCKLQGESSNIEAIATHCPYKKELAEKIDNR